MIRFACPACGKRLKLPADALGKPVRCPKCLNPLSVTESAPAPEEPPADATVVDFTPGTPARGEEPVFDVSKLDAPDEPPLELSEEPDAEEEPRTRPKRRRRPVPPPRSRNELFDSPAHAFIVCGVIGAVLGALVGVFVSQYVPIFGDPFSLHLDEPWGRLRMGYAPGHALLFAVLGCAATLGLAFLFRYSKRP